MPFNFAPFMNPGQGGGQPSQGGGQQQPQQPQQAQPQQPPQGVFGPGQFQGWNPGANPGGQYMDEINRIQQELQMAQINGANPAVLAGLQNQLQQAQQAAARGAQQYAYGRERNRPGFGGGTVGSGGRGGQMSESQMRGNQLWDMLTQMGLGSFGMGMGGGPGIDQ